MKGLFIAIFLVSITIVTTQLDHGLSIQGDKDRPVHLAALPAKSNHDILSPYSADTTNILERLRLFKKIYYVGATIHGAYLAIP
ncbi:MAG: hypothetical protein KKH83_02295 [Candidatus Margulisbacteria bacterium]|nr:hypothetical protein [Candidatus Margulisiibacteriota bacterium]